MIFMIDPMQALVFVIFLVILQQLEGNIIYPKVEDTFWSKVIGLGYPTPEAPGFRWCTERLKINPMNKFVNERIKESKEEKRATEENLKEQRTVEYSYTFKGSDLKSVTDSFIKKMSSLSTTMSPITGFDMKA